MGNPFIRVHSDAASPLNVPRFGLIGTPIQAQVCGNVIAVTLHFCVFTLREKERHNQQSNNHNDGSEEIHQSNEYQPGQRENQLCQPRIHGEFDWLFVPNSGTINGSRILQRGSDVVSRDLMSLYPTMYSKNKQTRTHECYSFARAS